MQTFDKHVLNPFKFDTSFAYHIYELIKDKQFDLDDDMFNDPTMRKMALVQIINQSDIGLANALIQKFNMDLVDNSMIHHILSYIDASILSTFIEFGFKFESDLINPFALTLWLYNQDEIPTMSLFNSQPFASTHQSAEIIKMLETLIQAGYDIHADDELALRFCFQPDILSFFINHGCNIHRHTGAWIQNYKEFFGGNFTAFPLQSIKLLIKHGIDLSEHVELLITHAVGTVDYDLMKLLVDNNISIKSQLQSQMKNLGNNFSTKKAISEYQIEDLINLLIANECDLSEINPTLITLISIKGYHQVLELLIKNGVDIIGMQRSAGLIKTGTHQNPIYLTVKLYMDLGLNWDEIFYLLFSNRSGLSIGRSDQSN